MDTNGLDSLRGKLGRKMRRVKFRYDCYEMKQKMRKISAVIPPEFRKLNYSLGWCAKAVDSLADRILFDGFENDFARIGGIFRLNNADILFDSAILSALISSCCFIYISNDGNGFPKLECIDGGNATGIIDTTTNLLYEGYAVLEKDDYGTPKIEAYFLPYRTEYYEYGKSEPFQVFEHQAPYPLLVPIIHRPDAKRPFGHSRISRSCMSIVDSALRTLLRTEVASEFYSVPQKYVVGLSQDAEFDNHLATLSSFLNFRLDDEGKVPTHIGQFQTGSIEPFLSDMKMLASLFAGETGLTLDDLGFSTDNPASYEAIKASHENLRLTARKAQRTFGSGFLNVGYLSACIRDNYAYQRNAFAGIQAEWMPVFEPDAGALGGIGDAILKINQASPDFMGARNIRSLTGLESDAD